ncbi:hypothetical protein [Paractinoplanes durhamensis]|uniref:Uncharacterized protein n=1 Tax=Paractinoplanes durhamensis TaxID=113563 RepID=A0ABQ3Z4A3_9ACTN|nr:hypothetical protein [Actinoplanes durhamensis]GIE04678.1 hypothetical protein Adu01nite_60280 [Actinoplanes durhamensis]
MAKDELVRVVHATAVAGIEGVRRPAVAMRAQPPAADLELDAVFRAMTASAARSAARPPALVDAVHLVPDFVPEMP